MISTSMDQELSCSSNIENYFRLYSALRILPHCTVVLAGSRTPPLGVTLDLRAFGFSRVLRLRVYVHRLLILGHEMGNNNHVKQTNVQRPCL
jgi:hypothetical protein